MSRIIRTERLVLGPYRHKLIGLYIDWLNNKELMKYSEQRHIKHTISSQRHYLKSFDGENSFWWEINANSQPVGSITAFCDWPNKTADIGLLIAQQGNGYGTEAWQVIIDWLFERGIRKIEAGCMASNAPMIKVFSKTGMVIEGRRRQHFLLDGKAEDMILAARFL